MLIDEYRPLLNSATEGGGVHVQSLAVWRFLFDLQKTMRISGDMLEIGVWHGAGVAAMRLHADEGETVHGVDIGIQRAALERTIKSVLGSDAGISLREGNSIDMAKASPFNAASFRWVHIDGEHSYNAVRSDLELAEKCLCDGGIVAVDDFFNINSACITQAVFDAIAARPHALRMFLAGANKAYLANPRHVSVYRREILRGFVDFAELEFGEQLMIAQQGHGTEIDYVTVSGRHGEFKGMRPGEFLAEPPVF
jgi:predicted O-methyltransferase YrrM